jgi:hypothetical protein
VISPPNKIKRSKPINLQEKSIDATYHNRKTSDVFFTKNAATSIMKEERTKWSAMLVVNRNN